MALVREIPNESLACHHCCCRKHHVRVSHDRIICRHSAVERSTVSSPNRNPYMNVPLVRETNSRGFERGSPVVAPVTVALICYFSIQYYSTTVYTVDILIENSK